jgi:hypothetical protein
MKDSPSIRPVENLPKEIKEAQDHNHLLTSLEQDLPPEKFWRLDQILEEDNPLKLISSATWTKTSKLKMFLIRFISTLKHLKTRWQKPESNPDRPARLETLDLLLLQSSHKSHLFLMKQTKKCLRLQIKSKWAKWANKNK